MEAGGWGRGVQAGEADRQRTLDHVVIAILQSHKAVLVRISYLQDREGSLIKLLLMPQRDSLVYGFPKPLAPSSEVLSLIILSLTSICTLQNMPLPAQP